MNRYESNINTTWLITRSYRENSFERTRVAELYEIVAVAMKLLLVGISKEKYQEARTN